MLLHEIRNLEIVTLHTLTQQKTWTWCTDKVDDDVNKCRKRKEKKEKRVGRVVTARYCNHCALKGREKSLSMESNVLLLLLLQTIIIFIWSSWRGTSRHQNVYYLLRGVLLLVRRRRRRRRRTTVCAAAAAVSNGHWTGWRGIYHPSLSLLPLLHRQLYKLWPSSSSDDDCWYKNLLLLWFIYSLWLFVAGQRARTGWDGSRGIRWGRGGGGVGCCCALDWC